MIDIENLRNYMIEMYKRSLALNLDICIYENYKYTYNEDLDELHLVSIDTSMNNSTTLYVLDVFDVIDSYVIDFNSYIKVLYLGSRVKCISEYAFSPHAYLTEVLIDSSKTSLIINSFAFSGCSELTTFKCNRIYRINPFAFSHCCNLSDINLSNTVYIGRNSFNNNKSLKSLYLRSITELEDYSFCFCDNLEFIYIGKHLLSLNSNTFYGCTHLKEVIFASNCNYSSDSFSMLSFN